MYVLEIDSTLNNHHLHTIESLAVLLVDHLCIDGPIWWRLPEDLN